MSKQSLSNITIEMELAQTAKPRVNVIRYLSNVYVNMLNVTSHVFKKHKRKCMESDLYILHIGYLRLKIIYYECLYCNYKQYFPNSLLVRLHTSENNTPFVDSRLFV